MAVVDEHVDDDMADRMDALGIIMGKGVKVGAWGASRGGLEGVGMAPRSSLEMVGAVGFVC